jgi:hypothetical protein
MNSSDIKPSKTTIGTAPFAANQLEAELPAPLAFAATTLLAAADAAVEVVAPDAELDDASEAFGFVPLPDSWEGC